MFATYKEPKAAFQFCVRNTGPEEAALNPLSAYSGPNCPFAVPYTFCRPTFTSGKYCKEVCFADAFLMP
jgi:hypothetical protein